MPVPSMRWTLLLSILVTGTVFVVMLPLFLVSVEDALASFVFLTPTGYSSYSTVAVAGYPKR